MFHTPKKGPITPKNLAASEAVFDEVVSSELVVLVTPDVAAAVGAAEGRRSCGVGSRIGWQWCDSRHRQRKISVFTTWQSLILNYVNNSFYLSFSPKAGSISSLSIQNRKHSCCGFPDFWGLERCPEEWRHWGCLECSVKARPQS